MLLRPAYVALLAFCLSPALALGQATGTVVVRVVSDAGPIEHATVRIGQTSGDTNAAGEVELTVAEGPAEITVERFGYGSKKVTTTVKSGAPSRVVVELEEESVVSENVLVTATRTNQRIQDLPLRVEVVPQEEIDEKLSMTPGDVAMMLTETNGLRVQVTSPSTGAANVRVQGLRGRYTQILSDGLPLYGQAGSISVLQIPPMDLGQVEVIKGVASALYGSAALGGVINLVSRRPREGHPEREVLLNRTSRGGTDGAVWLSRRTSSQWGYTFLGGAHVQTRQDVNRDGWSDIPSYQRVVARPRVLWEDGRGRSVLATVGGMFEDRDGGTVDGATAPDGRPFVEALDTRRVDAGVVGRFPWGPSRIFTFRSSGLVMSHTHQFGESRERDRHDTWFAEGSLNGTAGRHTWVAGTAVQQDGYRGRDLPAFDFRYSSTAFFAQDDYSPVPWLSASLSGRVDLHSDFGNFFSPRVSILAKPLAGWRARLSTGTGFFVPTPFIEEIEAIGLSRLSPLGDLEPERGRSVSLDLGWKHRALELTATVFGSRIDHVLTLRDTDVVTAPLQIANAPGPVRTSGTELIARLHHGGIDLIATHMYVRATEPYPEAGLPAEGSVGRRREVPLNPRHSAGIDFLWELEGRARLGLEAFYTGRQQLDDSPYRQDSKRYWLFGVIGEWRVRGARIFVNAENLADFRQTKHVPLVRPFRAADGRWLDDEWGPLDGRVFNAGVRLRF
jgi:outer membrane receptor for ferrienterochelin and colicins